LLTGLRVRGIARIGGSVLQPLFFGFQFFDTPPEPFEFLNVRKRSLEQLQQIFSHEFIGLFGRHRHHCGADDSKVSENL
jgi:hypothetical protein